MIQDFLLILIVFVLGYVLFIATAYLLIKWMLPKIEEDEDLVLSQPGLRQVHRNMKKSAYLTR